MDAEQLRSFIDIYMMAKVEEQNEDFVATVSKLQSEMVASDKSSGRRMRERVGAARPPTRNAHPKGPARSTHPSVRPQTRRHWVVPARTEPLTRLSG